MKEKRSLFAQKRDAAYRYLLWQSALGHSENIYVAEFPKSGGTWLSQLLSGILNLPFPRNTSVKNQPCILHGHHQINNKKIIHMMRDGRDVMISAYHYFLLSQPRVHAQKWQKMMGNVNLNDVKSQLPNFIEIFHTQYKSGGTHKQWGSFVTYYLSHPKGEHIKYEDLNQNTEKTIVELLNKWNINFDLQIVKEVINRYDFKNQTGRNKGENQPTSFLRKGSVGDWKNYFNKESAEVFNFYSGDALVHAEYEQNKNWY